jgi:hypothetical protein
MQAALEILDIPTWHNVTMAQNTNDMAMWTKGLQAKYSHSDRQFGRPEFDQLLAHWGACTDQPANVFAEELVSAYPEAKVVLVERDEDKWYRSFCEGVIKSSTNWTIPFVVWLSPNGMVGQYSQQQDLMIHNQFRVTSPKSTASFSGKEDFFDQWRANARRTYREHYELVKKVTPRERLLQFDLKDGWPPLCEFLGKPIPEVPFPWVNETKAVQEKVNLIIAESFKRAVVGFAKKAVPAFIAVAALFWYWRQV